MRLPAPLRAPGTARLAFQPQADRERTDDRAKPAMEASCAASSSAVDGIALGTPGRPAATRRHARRGSPGVLLTRARVSGTTGAARAVQLAIAGIADISERGNAANVASPLRARWNGTRGVNEPSSTKTRYLHFVPLGSQSAHVIGQNGGKRDTRVSLDVPLLGATTRDAERLGISFDRA